MDSSDLYRDHFGASPEILVAAPGRVNLIGEHTDYSHLPVLPIAVDRRLLIAAGAAEGGIEAISTLDREPLVLPSAAVPGWGRYVSGALGVLGDRAEGLGARLAIGGDLPATGGLSSSSALTVGVLWALTKLWRLGLGRDDVVDLAIEAERSVGVESGGMDQTVIAHAIAGNALRIDFEPPRRRHVPIPEHVSFVIGYSGEPTLKGATAALSYNRSVVSCRAATVLLARAMGRRLDEPPRLRQVADASLELVGELPNDSTPLAVATAAGVDVAILTELTSGGFPGGERIHPRAAARHVLSEAGRVDAAEAALAAGDGPMLGALLDASQASLAAYGVSTTRLDLLTAAARASGAWGSRLTGAGFGGWAVAVCSQEVVTAVTGGMTAATGGPAFPVVASGGLE